MYWERGTRRYRHGKRQRPNNFWKNLLSKHRVCIYFPFILCLYRWLENKSRNIAGRRLRSIKVFLSWAPEPGEHQMSRTIWMERLLLGGIWDVRGIFVFLLNFKFWIYYFIFVFCLCYCLIILKNDSIYFLFKNNLGKYKKKASITLFSIFFPLCSISKYNYYY